MLRFLRKYSSSTGVKILYGVLAAAFVIWGVGVVGGERVDLAARVRGEPITRREVDRTSQLLQRRYEAMRLPPELTRGLDLRARALDELIERTLIRQEAAALGLEVSDDDVLATITRMPELQDNGRFDRDRLAAFLQAQRDRGEFESDVRNGLVFDRLRAVVVDGVGVTPAEVTARFHLDRDKLNLAFVRVPAAELAKDVTLTDEELQKYLDEHAARYVVPAKVRARYVVFRAADFAEQVTPTDGEVAEYYELNKDTRFTDPEQVRARHILVRVPADATDEVRTAARKKAEGLLAKAKGGADFAALAKANSDDPGSAAAGGDLGLFPRGRMTPEFEAAAFALQPGQLSEVIETPFGLHVIKVEEHPAGGPRALESVRDEIVKQLRLERGFDRARTAAEGARAAVVKGQPLTAAADGRPVVETDLFAADEIVPGVGRVRGFNEASFALADGEVSDLVETDDAVYLLSPFGRAEARTPPLAEVRERVAADARRERAERLATERGETLRARAREVGLGKAAEEAGRPLEETGPFDRRMAIPTIGASAELRGDAFALTSEAPLAPRVYTVGGDAVVVALKERTPAPETDLAGAQDGIRDALLEQKRAAAMTEYVDALKQRAGREGGLEVYGDRPTQG